MRTRRALGVAIVGVACAFVAACTGSANSHPGPGDSGSGQSSAGPLPPNLNAGSGKPKRGGTLDMLGTGDVDYMDPNVTYYSIGYLNLRMWSRQLLTYPAVPGKVTEPAADLATEVPSTSNGGISADGLTYKLTIRKGAMWDTTPARQVTAADAVRGLKRTCNPAHSFGGMPDFQDLIKGLAAYCKGFAKVDPKSASAIANYEHTHDVAGVSVDPSHPLTVVYTLTHPASYFLPELTLPAFSPAPKEFDNYIPGSAQFAQHTISDGPYKISKYVATKTIDFVRNPAWKASSDPIRKAYVDKIDINETGQQDSIQKQLEAGTPSADMEWDAFPSVTAIPRLLRNNDPNLNLRPSFAIDPYLVFNIASPNNGDALSKVKVRQALSRAIDRDHLIQDLAGAQVAPPLTHILPKGISGTKSNTSPDPFKHDVQKAKSELKSAGHANMTLKVLYRSESSASKAIFETLQQDLNKTGITIKGVGSSNADFITKYLEVPSAAKRGTWDIAISAWSPDWYGDAALSFFSPLFYGKNGKAGSAFPPNGSDVGFYTNNKVDALTEQASRQKSASAAARLWAQADRQVTMDAAIYPIAASNQPTYHASQTHNTVFIPEYQQIDPTNVWLSKG